jgi:hypothetical protein
MVDPLLAFISRILTTKQESYKIRSCGGSQFFIFLLRDLSMAFILHLYILAVVVVVVVVVGVDDITKEKELVIMIIDIQLSTKV